MAQVIRLVGGIFSLLGVVAVFTSLVGPLSAQSVLKRPEPMREIMFTKVVTLGDTDGPGYVGFPARVVQRQNGEWVLTDKINQAEIKFYSSDGKWLRTLGRMGEGPGEYRRALLMRVEPDDGLKILDSGLSRVTHLSPTLEVLETTPIRAQGFSFSFLPDGSFAVGAQLNGPTEVGLPIHLLDSDGQIIRSFGADPPIREWGNPYKVWRELTPSGVEAVWSAHLTEYTIERWNLDGKRTHYLTAEVPWFLPHDRFGTGGDRTKPPNPGTYRIYEDPEGMLWVAIRVAGTDWQEALETRSSPGGRERTISTDANLTYDTIVEVIDPTREKVIASGTHPLALWGFTNQGDLIFHRFLDDNTPVCEIWKADFVNAGVKEKSEKR